MHILLKFHLPDLILFHKEHHYESKYQALHRTDFIAQPSGDGF